MGEWSRVESRMRNDMSGRADESSVFSGFERLEVEVSETRINAVRGGEGPPVLLLHGHPQTHMTWHRVAPILAERFTVVCADLRGYGDSSKPRPDPSHSFYSKRTMARDQFELMRELGFERFALVGHDRGARVARRLALDEPQAVSKLGILDIVPTQAIYGSLDQERATTVWRYFFLIQPFDLPEHLIGSDPGFYLDWTFREWCKTPGALSQAALSEYRRCFDADTIRASCEDYRAGATVDLADDQADNDRRISCPVLVLWSEGGIGAAYDVVRIWQQEGEDVDGRGLDCGHFLPEERPAQVAYQLAIFLGDYHD
jgi:haloacetate dehalogenase